MLDFIYIGADILRVKHANLPQTEYLRPLACHEAKLAASKRIAIEVNLLVMSKAWNSNYQLSEQLLETRKMPMQI